MPADAIQPVPTSVATPMTIKSLDPRVTRAAIPVDDEASWQPLADDDQLETYEVFHQERRGEQHEHVGIVHAASPETALIFAKEQYGRRSRCVSLWVVRTADVHVIGVEDADIFETAQQKDYREAKGYRVSTRLTEYKRRQKAANNE